MIGDGGAEDRELIHLVLRERSAERVSSGQPRSNSYVPKRQIGGRNFGRTFRSSLTLCNGLLRRDYGLTLLIILLLTQCLLVLRIENEKYEVTDDKQRDGAA